MDTGKKVNFMFNRNNFFIQFIYQGKSSGVEKTKELIENLYSEYVLN